MVLLPLETRANIFTILHLLGARQTIFLLHFHDLAISRNQTNLLLKTRAQLEHAMKETEHPLRVNSENIYTRFVMILMQMLVMN